MSYIKYSPSLGGWTGNEPEVYESYFNNRLQNLKEVYEKKDKILKDRLIKINGTNARASELPIIFVVFK